MGQYSISLDIENLDYSFARTKACNKIESLDEKIQITKQKFIKKIPPI